MCSLIDIVRSASYTYAENEDACAKLWKIYVDEAERYDKGLVERWRDDMSGMLIFVSYIPMLPETFTNSEAVRSLFDESYRLPDRELQDSAARSWQCDGCSPHSDLASARLSYRCCSATCVFPTDDIFPSL